MEIKEGYVYHIKSDYFEFANDDKIMKEILQDQIIFA